MADTRQIDAETLAVYEKAFPHYVRLCEVMGEWCSGRSPEDSAEYARWREAHDALYAILEPAGHALLGPFSKFEKWAKEKQGLVWTCEDRTWAWRPEKAA